MTGGSGHSSTVPAIGVMCLGVFCLSISDACAKWLGEHYSTPQVIFSRTALGLLLLTLVGIARGGLRLPLTGALAAHLGRGLIATGGAFGFVYGVRSVPLAEATTLIFIVPLIIAGLSRPLLRETVSGRHWLAILLGLMGVLIVIRPGLDGVPVGVLALLGAALCFALLMMTASLMPRSESTWTLTFYIMLVPMLASGLLLPWTWTAPMGSHLPVFLGIGISSTAGLFLVSQAFRLGPAAVVAPFDYLSLIWASAIGWILWAELPDRWFWVGAAVIIASTLLLPRRALPRPTV